VSISVGSNAVSHQAYASNAYSAYGAGNNASKGASASADNAAGASSSASTSVTLSEEAKAYLARNATAQDDTPSMAILTENARAWFDQQYATLGISSAMLDGQVAVDLSQQTRATLSAVADDASSQFTPDEAAAAAKVLQGRFDDAVSPHVVIARHTGDYASLYAAASDYLDKAGADEKATKIWQDQKQAVQDGLAAARVSFGKAPVTGNEDDPVRALLSQTPVQAPVAAGASPDQFAARARAMLDAQAGSAKDNGKELVFNSGRTTGQQADFTDFDNRTLAIMALNGDASFSAAEASAAKAELNQRTRSGLLAAFNPGSGSGAADMTLGLLQQYQTMSPEEKSVLGFSDDFADKIMKNYRTMSSIQSSFGSGGGLAAYL
jgi:hypothetical protein